jgi:hypothetical protein
MKQIKVRVIFERTCPATPEYYGGEIDIEKMKEMEQEQMEDGEILWDMIDNTEPQIEVTAEEII